MAPWVQATGSIDPYEMDLPGTVQDPVEWLWFSILSQQISMAAATAIFRRLPAALGGGFAPERVIAATTRHCWAGLIVYEDAGGRYVFTHAFIAGGYRGRGLCRALRRGVLEDLKQRHITVTTGARLADVVVPASHLQHWLK